MSLWTNPRVIIGAAAAAVAVGKVVHTAYQRFSKKEKTLGTFIVWGLPDTGKSTFISIVLGKPHAPRSAKEATTSAKVYKDEIIRGLEQGPQKVEKITDLPGTNDRLGYWLQEVKDKEVQETKNVFYLVNLARFREPTYMSSVRFHIKKTLEAMASNTSTKRLNIIGTHLDQSEWKGVASEKVNNELQGDDAFRELYESTNQVAGYVYAANLTDQSSAKNLLQSITNDILAKP
jgi:GTPase Era involved in 16S rRNA processing